VSGQDDRERELHARDGVWLPAGGEQPAARGLPGSRHTPRPGIAKGEAFSPLARLRPPQVGRSPASARRNGHDRFRTRPRNPDGCPGQGGTGSAKLRKRDDGQMAAGLASERPPPDLPLEKGEEKSNGLSNGSAAVPLPYSGSSRA
jgi:hypothetical protein